MTHEELIKWVQQQVHSICPHGGGSLQYLYHAGFLASAIATLIEHDSANAHIFKRIIKKNQQKQRKRGPAVSYKPEQ